jgi:hypothetical protein
LRSTLKTQHTDEPHTAQADAGSQNPQVPTLPPPILTDPLRDLPPPILAPNDVQVHLNSAFDDIIQALDQFVSGIPFLNDKFSEPLAMSGVKIHAFIEWSYVNWPRVYGDMWKKYMYFAVILQNNPDRAGLADYPQYQHLLTCWVRYLSPPAQYEANRLERERHASGVLCSQEMIKSLSEWTPDAAFPGDLTPLVLGPNPGDPREAEELAHFRAELLGEVDEEEEERLWRQKYGI